MADPLVKLKILRNYRAYISTLEENNGKVNVSAGEEAVFPLKVAKMLVHDRVGTFDSVVIPEPGVDGRPLISDGEVASATAVMDEAMATADRLAKEGS